MGEIAVTIGGRRYPVACDDGQEEHVAKLAAYIDRRAGELAESVGKVGEARLLVMISLIVADELADAYDEVDRLQSRAKTVEKTVERKARSDTEAAIETRFAPIVEALAERIESIAGRLENG